jgi:hypothetical protein
MLSTSVLIQPYFDQLGAKIVSQIRQDLVTKNLTGFGPSNATGRLSDSLRYEATNEGLRVYALDYIYYLEKGRKPGKRPPVDALIPWVKARGMATDDKQARSIAFLIARKIGENGTTIFQKGGSDLISAVVSDQMIQQVAIEVGTFLMGQITKVERIV